MKRQIILLLLSFGTFSGFSQGTNLKWNEILEKQHLNNRQDTATWDKELLQRDINDSLSNSKGKPFPHGAFPVPKYDLAGKFRYRGAGAGGTFKNYFDKKLVYSFFFANKTAASETILKEKENEVFFLIVMLTDFIDTVNYTHGSAYLLSRNNPDVTCEGFFKTKTDEVDYMAFLTANRDEFGVVNMRLFNLKSGRIILIAPQKDHSLRSLQLTAPILSTKEVPSYLDKILIQDNVKSFFMDKGNL
jgi:hypothetical protein